MRIAARLSVVTAALMCLASAAQAQSATVQALANVLQPITVTGARDLDFGTVFPGVAKAIAVADPTSGRFDLTGSASANLNLSFTLPTDLSSGGNLLPIGSWTGCHNGTNNTATCTAFTPSAGNTPTAFSGAGALFVWVGGTVTPAANQAAGSYAGTVQLTVAYF